MPSPRPTVLVVAEESALSQTISAWQLLSYYLDLGKPVVALQHLGGPPGRFAGQGVELVPWPPTRRALLDAVHRRLPGSQAHALAASGPETGTSRWPAGGTIPG